ncbi:MAG: glycosyltransferase family 2 protein [Thaumarchaeota archaeon]|nr:glycosyltransferase family 2 protein [Nitrososphaerota archaeon]
MKLVCIPAFNEEKTIGEIVEKSLQYADNVIVCNDGSTDNTEKKAKEKGAIIINHKKNLGYGAAIISLFEEARKQNAEIMVTLDGDGQHDPAEIPNLVKALIENKVDVVIGSRFLGKKTNSPVYRKTGIKIITSASNLGTDFKVTDSQSGFRVYSKKAIDLIHPTEEGMSVSTEILLKISNWDLSIAETPITVSYEGETSTHRPVPQGVSVLMNTLKFISVKHPITFYGIPGIAMIISGLVFGVQFLDEYLYNKTIFYGSLLGSIILFLVGSIILATAIILYSMATLMSERK